MTVTTERRGLGRGLGELFQRTDVPAAQPAPQEPAPTEPLVPVPAGSSYADLPLESIVPNPRQPRTVFDGDALDELVDSIREVGLLQPVVVRPLGDDTYELVMGERRWRASQLADTGTIPAIVRPTEDHDLLRDRCSRTSTGRSSTRWRRRPPTSSCSRTSGARRTSRHRIKRSRPQISNTIRLLRLPPTVQRRVAAGVLTPVTPGRCWACPTRSAGAPRAAGRGRGPVGARHRGARHAGEARPADRADQARSSPTLRAGPRAGRVAERPAGHAGTVDAGRKRGRIVIEFPSEEDLERIASILGG